MALQQANRALKLNTPLGADVLLLTAFEGHEELSRLFSYRLDMISDDNAIEATDIVGKNVTFSIEMADDTPRYFNGFVSRFVAGDEDDQGRRNYRAEVIPWLWFLTRTTDCRIFQNKSVPEIIEQIFGDLGFSDYEVSQIKGSHPKWDYCVQYRESDFAFVSRLMEQEGIFYFFRHEDGKHTLVLADHKGAYETAAEDEVDFPHDSSAQAVADHITSWEHAWEFRTGKWAHTDYNFETPSNSLMTTEQTVIDLPDSSKYEFYDYPGEYGTTGDGTPLAKMRMEEEEAGYDVVHASSRCKSFSPGFKFSIGQHRTSGEEGKSYVVTSIRHSATEPMAYETGTGTVAEDYSNTFTCIPDSVAFRPARTTRKPLMRGCQTAVVTGPAGEEIYPDKFGRVKVQFHWDREGKKDEKTSCWIRVSQIHAGKGWGAIDIPRIGEEVIVDFLEGDPDRPIIIGRVYHAESMPPYELPGSMNLYGMKSNSTKGGGGYNEYVFDDTKSTELIREHGQFDKDSTIEHDLREHVLNDRSRDVTNNETVQIGNDRSETVGHDETLTVANHRIESVGVNETLSVGSNRSRTVGGSETITVAMTRTHSVGINEAILVGAAREVNVGGAQTIGVGASQSISVGANQNVSVGKNLSESVGKDRTEKVKENRTSDVGKDDSLKVGKKLTINAGDQITIKTGQASITMKKSGDIVIKGKKITIEGMQKIEEKAAQITSEAKAKNLVKGALVNVEASAINTIKGALVKIN